VRSPKNGTYLKLPSSWKIAELKAQDSPHVRSRHQSDEDQGVGGRSTCTPDSSRQAFVASSSSVAEQDAVIASRGPQLVLPIDEGAQQRCRDGPRGGDISQGVFRGQRSVFNTPATVGPVQSDQITFLDKAARIFLSGGHRLPEHVLREEQEGHPDGHQVVHA